MAVLTVHVLDWTRGTPAREMNVQLYRILSTGEKHMVFSGRTDESGRLAQPLLREAEEIKGNFELHFDVGSYFAKQGQAAGLWEWVPIAFRLDGSEGDVHIPLLVTPWGYTTYRGS